MTVDELIAELQKLDGATPICVAYKGKTFEIGKVSERRHVELSERGNWFTRLLRR